METVGIYELKTRISALMKRVERGEEIRITRNGASLARIVPDVVRDQQRVEKAIAEMRALREKCSLGGLSWKELRDEGRK